MTKVILIVCSFVFLLVAVDVFNIGVLMSMLMRFIILERCKIEEEEGIEKGRRSVYVRNIWLVM